VPERCDALDNDCDGATDEDFPLGAGCEVGIGECVRAGGLVCAADGSGTACDAVPGDPAAEACDGLDNDCDGIADNGFPIGDACTAGTGECVRAGALVCSADGSGTTCDAVPGEPLTDVCNGLDDDCDGVPDGAFDVGAPCTEGQGECEAAGAKVCREDLAGTVCDAVAGAPADEVCNGLDDDCDGETDDGFDLAGPCTVGTGACAAAGEPRCSDDGAGVECEGEPGAASAELCNGVDDDCDGATDEDFVIGEPCEAGVGACHAAGTIVCTADGTGLECGAKAGEPVAELCNGADDDCDGDTDEAFVLGDACSVGLGTCRAEGTLVCTDDGTGTRCSAEPGEPGVLESCDGLDNDCDGGTDEDYDVGAACASGRGACAADGVLACNDAGNGTECTATPGEPADETCNGIDDDCDGETDEAGACAPEPSPDAGDAHEPEPVPEPELPPDPVPEPEPEAASEPRPDLPDESTEGPSPDVPAIDSVGPAPDVAGEGRAGGSGGCNSAHTASAWWLMLLLLAAASVQGMVRTRSADRP
jgi:hypothetical protein